MPWPSLPSTEQAASDVLSTVVPGDVVLTTGCDDTSFEPPRGVPVSRLIREATKAPVSHALVIYESGVYVDAGPGRSAAVSHGAVSDLARSPKLQSCYLLRHHASEGISAPAFRSAIRASAEHFMSDKNSTFATADVLKGLLLLLVRHDGPGLIEELGLRDQIKRWVGGGPRKLFCSEFVYRCFTKASETAGAQEYRISCEDLLLHRWRELLAPEANDMSAGPLEVEPGSIMALLAERGDLERFGWPVILGNDVEGNPSTGHSSPPSEDAAPAHDFGELGTDVLRLLDLLRTQGPTASFADFVTPRDILHASSFTVVARWGLGPGEVLDPWRCEPVP